MEEFLYHRIDIPKRSEIDVEVQALYNENPMPAAFHVIKVAPALDKMPTLRDWFAENGLSVHTIALINMKPGQVQSIHVDYSDSDIAFNYPIKGCDTSVTRFYKNKGTKTVKYTPNTNLPFYEYVDENPEQVGEYVLTDPVILNIKMPHSVKNYGLVNRICLSFRFKNDPWFLIGKGKP